MGGVVGCRRGVGMESVITMTALSRQIKGVEGVLWCGVGSVITEHHSMFVVA